MSTPLKHAISLAAIATLWISLPASGAELTASEMRTLITDKTIYVYNMDDRRNVIWYFAADGKVTQRTEKGVSKQTLTSTGTWRMDEQERLCVQLQDPFSGQPEKERCRKISKEDDKYHIYGIAKDGRKTRDTGLIKQIADGNVEKM